MRMVLLTLVVLVAMGLAGGAAIIGFGLYNVSAQAGHMPGVSWLLHATFKSSVRLRAPSMDDVPPLDDPDLIALGAGHYATACIDCHAAPDDQRTATVRAMVPVPPPIREAVAEWQPNELHWIVENGIKMSGMPGWPVRKRGDEVWAVVAYLMALKQQDAPSDVQHELDGSKYCRSCHGEIGGTVPRLDIQEAAYLSEQLRAYVAGVRPSGIMAQAASRVPADRIDDLARQFASEGASAPPVSLADDSAGAQLARKGTRDVPACLACHAEGNESRSRKGPALFGQTQQFLSSQLRLWRDGIYTHDALMRAATRDLSDADIALLSEFFAGTVDH